MEHRCSTRTCYRNKALIHHNSLPVAFCTIRNVCAGGMYVETGPLTYRKNTPLEIEFTIDNNGFRLPAMVVHNTDTGMGLMFLNADPKTVQGMLLMLNSGNKRSTIKPRCSDLGQMLR